MARLASSKETIRNLFARSGNRCAFPGCTSVLINEKSLFIGQICHIEAANEEGQRFSSNMTDEERRDEKNLLLLCYPHHKETDDVQVYSVKKLQEIKFAHEASFGQKVYKIDESALYRIHDEMSRYWARIEEHLAIRNLEREFPLDIDPKSSFFDILGSLKDTISGLEHITEVLSESDQRLPEDLSSLFKKLNIEEAALEKIPYYENPSINRNWEFHNIHMPNLKVNLSLHLCHLEIKFLEEYLKTNNGDRAAQIRLDELKVNLQHLIDTQGYVD